MDGHIHVDLSVLKDINFKMFFRSFIAYKNLILKPGMRQPSLHVGQCRIHCYYCIIFLHSIFRSQFQLVGMSARQMASSFAVYMEFLHNRVDYFFRS